MAEARSVGRPISVRKVLVPLALAQFICSFAGSNMNVMIVNIRKDVGTTVQGVQTAITGFLLVMAALVIPGGELTDRWCRKRCFTIGLSVYGIGAVMSAAVPGSILISDLGDPVVYAAAMIVLTLIGVLESGATLLLPARDVQRA
ncbi:MAG TPA: MFS transporter [Actinomycetota bacterium]|nr:MFS transporter [Actinomycetota bacterium]